ncbi:MAG: COX15/CtaA family protein, partial [Acidobacteria bacterium]|nr:COX15/CtaA family protein [Acidobacteriota bacterium]
MTHTALPPTPHLSRFRWLAFAASLTTFLLIVVGGIVRVTGSGMGCGEHWPLCNGQLFPPLDLPTFIELSHRFLTALVSPLIGAVAWVAWRSYRAVRWVVWPALAALALLVIQILLGAVTVRFSLPPVIVALHLANALALLGVLLTVTVVAFQLHKDPRIGDSLLHFDALSRLVGVTAVGVYGLLITGALVTATGSTGACSGWPLCNGAFLPVSVPGWLHMAHRYAAAGVGALIVASVIRAWQLRRRETAVPVIAAVTGALFAGQVLVGALNVVRGFPVFLNGLHLATAAAVWACMVVFA